MKRVKKRTGTFKSFDGTSIYYERRGEGKPIIFCYGIGCLINHWLPQIQEFSEGYQTIVFDYRGHHKTPPPQDPEQLSIDALARDLQALCEHLQLESASFWGHSFGAQVLVRAYDINPSIFSSLVFINGFASNPIKGMFGNNWAASTFEIVKQVHLTLPETTKYLWQKAVTNPLSIYASGILGGFNLDLTHLKDIEIYARGISSMNLTAFIHLFENMMSYDGRTVFDRIEVPTLIIGGLQDSLTPKKYQEEMHRRIRGSELQLIPYGSHCTQLDMPDFVNLRIRSFLKDIDY